MSRESAVYASTFKVSFYVEFPSGSALMSRWCSSKKEAMDLAKRYAQDAPVIHVHVPVMILDAEGNVVPIPPDRIAVS